MQITFKQYIALIPLLFLAFISNAQDNNVTFEMKLSKNKLGLNERLRVDFVMNKDGDDFNPPRFDGFKVVMGPSQSISSSWINGKRSYSKTYSYTLSPTARGKFTIKQASIIISGKTYKSLAKQVEVTAAVDKPNGQRTAADVADDNIHFVAEISNTKPYLNEAITVVYKLYVNPSLNISSPRTLDTPKYNNFWSQDIPIERLKLDSGTYKGEPYNYVVLKRVVLYPQKSGKLKIEGFSLDVPVDVPTNRRDFFGRPMYSQANKTVSAGNRTINVKPLPIEGKPASFTGAVGDFDFFVTTTKTHLNAGESLQAKVEINGKGNLKLFEIPKLTVPSSLEVYDPEVDQKVRTTFSGMQGKVSNSYTVVPSFKGKYPLPSIPFSYFNPKTEKYHTLNSEELIVNVLEGPTNTNQTSSSANTPTNSNRQAVVSTGNDFGFIKLKPNLSTIGYKHFLGSTPFYLWLLVPLIFIPIAILFGKKRDAIASDVVGNKVKKANKLAKKYLSNAKKALGNKDEFYIALEKALHNYLKAKLKIETSEFSKDKIASLLSEKKVNDATNESFIALLKNCEMARYSPFSDVQMQEDYTKASDVISIIDKQI